MAKKIFILAESTIDDYQGDIAPTKDDCPMWDLTDCYGEDIYGPDAYRLYGQDDERSHYVLSLLKATRNRKNKPVTIYRAVPNINSELEKEIKLLNTIINYYYKFNFFPPRSSKTGKISEILYDEMWDKYDHLKYDDQQKAILNDLERQVIHLKNEKFPLKINNGDWVTLNYDYAKQHGISHLNNDFKILRKTVKSSQLFTNGNSLMEWGYNI